MAAPNVNPYLTIARRLDEQFKFALDTKIYDTLNKLVTAIEARLQPLDQKVVDIDAVIDGILAIALQRMDETFTPLIEEATQRLEQFGVAFSASSTTTMTLGLGAKSMIIPVGQREGYVFGDYVAVRHSGGDESMTGQVLSYQRDIGQLNVNVISFSGAGVFADWEILFSAAPNLAHETRLDNPHQTTADQTGAYSIEEIDDLLDQRSTLFASQTNALQSQIDGLQSQISAQDSEISALQASVTALQAGGTLGALDTRVTTLETNVPIADRNNRWVG